MKLHTKLLATATIGLAVLVGTPAHAEKGNDEVRAQVEHIFATLDTIDPRKTSELYSDDSVLVYGNAPALVGKKAIVEMQKGFFSSIKGMKHTIKRIWESNSVVAVEMTVTYQRLDGSHITLPVTDVMTLKNGKVTETAVYMDSAPLFETTPKK